MGDRPVLTTIAGAIETARPVFEGFADHWRIASRAIERLAADERVDGLYLSGSFAKGKPDRWSDIDLYVIVVPNGSVEEVIRSHETLISEVADVATSFPATHLGDPNQLIVFYKGTEPIHVDYQYRKLGWLAPRRRDGNVMILLDRSGELERWREECQEAPVESATASEQLQYLEIRFWGWCWYTHTKIKRGELWEARDALEYLRSNVLVPLAHADAQPFEGNRRLEQKLSPDLQRQLASTIPASHSATTYSRTLDVVIDTYIRLFASTPASARGNAQLVDRDYFISAIREH